MINFLAGVAVGFGIFVIAETISEVKIIYNNKKDDENDR